MLSRRRAEGEPDYLREVKNEFMAQWDGIRYTHGVYTPPRCLRPSIREHGGPCWHVCSPDFFMLVPPRMRTHVYSDVHLFYSLEA